MKFYLGWWMALLGITLALNAGLFSVEIVSTNELPAGVNNRDGDIVTNVFMTGTNGFENATNVYRYGVITNNVSSAVSDKLYIGPVTVGCRTGKITIEGGVTLDEASLEFWKAVEQAYPEMFEDKVKKGNK